MTGKTLELRDILSEDQEAKQISNTFMEFDMLRNSWKSDKEEIRRYIFATDTTTTSNSQLPWKNKTTIPKLCQIRDNLYSNYVATLFPQRTNVTWIANELDAASVAKRDAIVNYMTWVMDQDSFKNEMDKIILDFIDYGNCFGTVEWIDERIETPTGVKFGYVGPSVRRINPLHIVMNPTAESFIRAPKIIRSLVSLGELKDMLEKLSTDDNYEEYKAIYEYLQGIRTNAMQFEGDWKEFENQYRMDGFTSFREYLKSGMVEILTFYGDLYNQASGEFFKNYVITVVDRHKLIGKKPNPSFFGYPPIFHSPWRKKPDNLWGMGPLDNLVGMQYRMDHIENMKADIFDLVTYPVQKIKGMVEEFTWQPGEKIFVSEEGDVELVQPQVQVLNANIEIQNLERLMEEMAGAPREAMGFRSPGEKTKYEVQRLENASSRVFQNKIKQFEEQVVEPLLNAMLELARRNLTGATVIQVFDDEFNASSFQTLTVEDITGVGRIKPIAARHFAEQAELIQNLTNLTQSNLWPTVQLHFSGKKLAKIVEKIFTLDQYEVVIPFIGLAEQAEAQKFNTALQEQVQSHAMTATGMNGDYDMAAGPQSQGRVASAAPPQQGANR